MNYRETKSFLHRSTPCIILRQIISPCDIFSIIFSLFANQFAMISSLFALIFSLFTVLISLFAAITIKE